MCCAWSCVQFLLDIVSRKSSTLFTIDGLLIKLTKSGMGCFFGPFFVGALAYADDLALLAPTATAMRKLLSICDDYGKSLALNLMQRNPNG